MALPTPPPTSDVGTLGLVLAVFIGGLTLYGLYELWGTPYAAPVVLVGGLVTALVVLAARAATRRDR